MRPLLLAALALSLAAPKAAAKAPPESYLTVTTTPSGVEVFLDGSPVGVTPLKRYRTTPGDRFMLLRLKGHKDVSKLVTLAKGGETKVEHTFAGAGVAKPGPKGPPFPRKRSYAWGAEAPWKPSSKQRVQDVEQLLATAANTPGGLDKLLDRADGFRYQNRQGKRRIHCDKGPAPRIALAAVEAFRTAKGPPSCVEHPCIGRACTELLCLRGATRLSLAVTKSGMSLLSAVHKTYAPLPHHHGPCGTDSRTQTDLAAPPTGLPPGITAIHALREVYSAQVRRCTAKHKAPGDIKVTATIPVQGKITFKGKGKRSAFARCVLGLMQAYPYRPAVGFGVTFTPWKPGKQVGRVRLSGGRSVGDCNKRDIRQRMRKKAGAIRLCYQNALVRRPELAGKVTVRYTIDTDGSVKDVGTSGAIADRKVLRCITKEVEKQRFGSRSAECEISWPFVFSSSGGKAR